MLITSLPFSLNTFTRRIYGAGFNAIAIDPLLPFLLKTEIRYHYSKCLGQASLIDYQERRLKKTISKGRWVAWHKAVNDFCCELVRAGCYKRDIERKLSHAHLNKLAAFTRNGCMNNPLPLALGLIAFDLRWLYEPWVQKGAIHMATTQSAKDFFHLLGECVSTERGKNITVKTNRKKQVRRILGYVRRGMIFKASILPPNQDSTLIFKSDEGRFATDHGKLLREVQLKGWDTNRNPYTSKTLKNLLRDNGIYLFTDNKNNAYLRALKKEKNTYKKQAQTISQTLTALNKA